MYTRCRRFILAVLFSCAFPTSVPGQEQPASLLPRPDDAPVRFEHLSVEDGLSQQTVYSILQDQKGFMWFGTQDGLNKYDGYRFTVYKPDPDTLGPHSPGTGGDIRALYEDREGMLWVGYSSLANPLDRFDPATETFTHFRPDPTAPGSVSRGGVYAILEDREGVLWFGGGWAESLRPADRHL